MSYLTHELPRARIAALQKRRSALLGSVVLWAMLLAAPAHAGTINVTTTHDQNNAIPNATCSLREAVKTANDDANYGGCHDASSAQPDRITLGAGDHKLLGSAALSVNEDLAIAGAGAGSTSIDGGGKTPLLDLATGAFTLSLRDLTVDNGYNPAAGGGIIGEPGTTLKLNRVRVTGNKSDGSGGGGGIYGNTVDLTKSSVTGNQANAGEGGGIYGKTVNLTRSTVSHNSMTANYTPGGGISAEHATITNSLVSDNTALGTGAGAAGIFAGSTLTMDHTTVRGNKANFDGGGLAADPAFITDSVVRDNTAGFEGGGISASGTLAGSAVTGNTAADGQGGGIFTRFGALTVLDSTIAGNASGAEGGGIMFKTPAVDLFHTFNLIDSTVAGNSSDSWGGGVSIEEGAAIFSSSTISGNTADVDLSGDGNGGGLDRSAGTVEMRNTILAGNIDTGGQFPDWNCNGGVSSQGHNLVGATEGCSVTPEPGDKSGSVATEILDPKLGLLAMNGGGTKTMVPAAMSPAIDAGDPGTPATGSTTCEATDQRGVPRNLASRCDIGAYERVSCHSRLVNVVGTSGRDRLTGTSAKDGILGLGGRDTLSGAGGKDGLCGGSSRDRLFGGSANDFLDGGSGHDSCDGGAGSDKSRRCEARLSIP